MADASTKKTKVDLLDQKVKRLFRIILRARKYQSIHNQRLKNRLFFAKELHLHELVKTMSKILRCDSPIQILNYLITENEVNKLSEMRGTARRLPTRMLNNV